MPCVGSTAGNQNQRRSLPVRVFPRKAPRRQANLPTDVRAHTGSRRKPEPFFVLATRPTKSFSVYRIVYTKKYTDNCWLARSWIDVRARSNGQHGPPAD